jgi:Protein of unknown function (DUF4019)
MHRLMAAAVLLLTAASAPSLAAQQSKEPDAGASPEALAQAAAETWLDLVWNGQVEESWETAAETFKQAVTAEQWASAGSQVMGQTGPFRSRSLETADRTQSLPNAPPGDYVVLTYSSVFENAPGREIVTMMLEDGEWKTIGYYVTPP